MKVEEPTGARVTVDRRLYLNEGRDKLVEEGDERARYLYCSQGKRMLRSELEAFGVNVRPKPKESKPKSKPKPKPKADKSKPEDKADNKADDKGK